MSGQSTGPIISSLHDDADMAELIDMYVDEMGGRAQSLRNHLEAGNWKQLANEAHKIRGSAGGHGFDSIGGNAAHLEDELRRCVGNEATIMQSTKQQVDELVSMCLRAKAR